MAEDVLRQRTARVARQIGTDEKILAMFEQVFNATTKVQCSHCLRPTLVPMPDIALWLKAVEAMEGKLPEPEQVILQRVDVVLMTLPEKVRYVEEKKRERETLALTRGDDAA